MHDSTAPALRSLIDRPGPIAVASAYDGFVSRIMEDEGFEVLMLSGNSASTSLGLVDLGLTTMTEVAEHLHHVTRAVEVPVLVDADNGFGGVLNVQRTIREMERAGAAGVMIEDQPLQKRSGLGGERVDDASRERLMSGRRVVDFGEAVTRVRAAVDARTNSDTVIVARTDSRSVLGLDAALERAAAFVDVGADVIYVEGPQSIDELAEISARVNAPILINDAVAGIPMSLDRCRELGIKFMVVSAAPTAAIYHAISELAQHVLTTGSIEGFEPRLAPRAEIDRVVGLEKLMRHAQDYEET